jgi:hypothetical protein
MCVCVSGGGGGLGVCVCVCVHIHTHTHTHTYIQTHINKDTHTKAASYPRCNTRNTHPSCNTGNTYPGRLPANTLAAMKPESSLFEFVRGSASTASFHSGFTDRRRPGCSLLRTTCAELVSRYPPRDGKGFKGFLPQLDEFYFTTGKKKISENADALFRIS